MQQLKAEQEILIHQKAKLMQEKSDMAFQKPIEKGYITPFIVQFLDVKNSKQVKQEMLKTLSALLEFSDEDMAKVGLSSSAKSTKSIKSVSK